MTKQLTTEKSHAMRYEITDLEKRDQQKCFYHLVFTPAIFSSGLNVGKVLTWKKKHPLLN